MPCAQAIVNVGRADEHAEAWPLRILDHRGEAHDITLAPGDALLYVSALTSTSLRKDHFPIVLKFSKSPNRPLRRSPLASYTRVQSLCK
eukprot:SAG31_NODE_15241_length_764_cov_0.831579_2_plen_88_part_01